jgi:hypothetical protein
LRLFHKPLKVLFVLLLIASAAAAYTPQFADNLFPLRWKNPVVRIALSNSLLKQNVNVKADSDVRGAVERSLRSWEQVSGIKFETVWTDKQSVSAAGNAGDGASLITIAQTPENLLLFSNDSEEVSARTRTFYNRRGVITEADIILNPYQQFSTDGSVGTFDLEATLTHEIGHLLGLEHSFVLGATMHAHQGKNGVYNLANLSSRTLAADDIAAVRSLYGANAEEENCCGTINGKLSLANGKPAKSFQVWAEEAETGRITAGVLTSADGGFRFEGLPSGKFQIYSQRMNEKTKNSFSVENLGEVEVKNEKPVNITKKLQLSSKPAELQYVGFNGQISDLAVLLNGGKSYVVYVGGKNFDSSKLKISFNSPYISVAPNSLSKYEYDFGISVVSFEIRISRKIPLGEYGVYVEDGSGRTYCLNGGLTIENFENPWSSNLLTESD